MRKIGINLQNLDGLTVEDYIKTISELGFQVSFTDMKEVKEQEKIANLFAKHNIEYETIHAPFNHINDMWLEGEDGEVMCKELMTCIDHCVIANASIMVVHLSLGMTPPPITDIGRHRFAILVEYAKKKNIQIAFENQRQLTNISWALETFTSDDNVGLCWDCGHEACFSLGREHMPLFGERLICTHIHDNEGVYNQDKHMIPFDGVVDFKRYAEHIRKSGYTGPLTLELKRKNSNYYDKLSSEQYLEKASLAVKKLLSIVDK